MYKVFSCLLATLLLGSTLMVVRADEPNNEVVYKSSDLIGKEIKNKAGDHIGYLEDLTLVTPSGQVAYAVLSTKNALGLGGKLYALPFSAFGMAPQNRNLVLDVPKNEFENKEGFDSNRWPQQVDERWAKLGRKDTPTLQKDAKLVRLTSINGLAVKNNSGQDLGKVQGFAVDWRKNKVDYVAMSHGGVAGFGSKYFAIPWQAMNLKSLDLRVQDRCFVLNANKEQFDQGAGFDQNNWPVHGNQTFLKNGKTPASR